VPFQRWKGYDNQKVQRYKYHSKALIRLALLDASPPEIMAGQKIPENARSESVMYGPRREDKKMRMSKICLGD
jgi:hypothetical protein